MAFTSLVLLILSLTFGQIVNAQGLPRIPLAPTTPTAPTSPPMPELRLIVKYKSTAPIETRNQFVRDIDAKRAEAMELKDAIVITIISSEGLRAVAQARSHPSVEYAELDAVAYKSFVPNDTHITDQWGLTTIRSFDAWDVARDASSVDIAILDTGIDGAHPDLIGSIVKRANFTTDADSDGDGHGTHVAGIAAAIAGNGMGVAGVSYNARLMSVKVLDNNGSGYYSWIANGIVWATDNGAEVINLSLGGTTASTTLSQAVQYATGKGVVVVAAAGNSGSTKRHYPAYYTPAIAVAAVDRFDRKASFSTYGSWVDLAAPGVSILSTIPGGYTYYSGTSMATPFVSGLAALVKGKHPTWSGAQVRAKLEASADNISRTGSYWVHGRINACASVDCDTQNVPVPTPTPILPSPTLQPTATPTHTPTPTPIATPTPTVFILPTIAPTPVIQPSPTPTPTPTQSPLPWWCVYAPRHSYCQ